LAVGVGPVKFCPKAGHKILFVLGAVESHYKLDWDNIIVTSRGAAVNLFNYASKTLVHPMPLLEMEAGRRRLMKKEETFMRLEGPCTNMVNWEMSAWSLPSQHPFSAIEFNSRCLNGGIGVYLRMDNGYDIQVRKHLAFGSIVYCPKDRGIIGDLADVVLDENDYNQKKHLEIKQEPIEDKVSKSDYITAIEDIIRRI
jgi:hypothetical protein